MPATENVPPWFQRCRSWGWVVESLALLCLILTGIMLRWPDIAASVVLPEGSDAGRHTLNLYSLRWVLASTGHECGDSLAHVAEILTWQGRYPPLVYLVALPFTQWLGPDAVAPVLSLLAWWVLLVLGTWYAGRLTWGPAAGVLAALAAGSAPLALETQSTFLLDLPAAAMVALALAILQATQTFTRPHACAGLGLVMGLAALTKWNTTWYLALPALFVGLRAFIPLPPAQRWRVGLLAGALLAVAGPGATFLLTPSRPVPLPGADSSLLLGWLGLLVALLLALAMAGTRFLCPGQARNLVVALATGLAMTTGYLALSRPWLATALAELPLPCPPGGRLAALAELWPPLSPAVALLLVGAAMRFLASAQERERSASTWLALVSGVGLTLLLSPAAARYFLPAVPCIALLGTSWLASLPRAGLPLALVVAGVCSLGLGGVHVDGSSPHWRNEAIQLLRGGHPWRSAVRDAHVESVVAHLAGRCGRGSLVGVVLVLREGGHATYDDYSFQQCALAWHVDLAFERVSPEGVPLPRDPDDWYPRAMRGGFSPLDSTHRWEALIVAAQDLARLSPELKGRLTAVPPSGTLGKTPFRILLPR